ncbi:uncharacterized protein LOC126810050 [Patella vulgata]|uniref:uncharacterized protein LOC126810050 n=1 Tax=Patella vulgata TaxID=6465 RepID=UPI0021805D2C|nr:uncharacterized protein LOC126810050 [Patella vulgata]
MLLVWKREQVLQSDCLEWVNQHKVRLTASNFGKLYKRIKMPTEIGDTIKLKVDSEYYCQVQGQLALTGINWCDFCVFLSDYSYKLKYKWSRE